MSVVCNVVSTAGTWLMCDGRAQKNGKIVSEHLKKFRAINKNVLVGFTGVLEIANAAFDCINKKCDQFELKNAKSDAFANILSDVLKKSNIQSADATNFVVTGLSSFEDFRSYVVMQSGQMQCFAPTSGNDVKYVTLGDLPENIHMHECLSNSIKKYGFTEAGIISGMQDYIYSLAEQRSSINKNITMAKILGQH